MGVFSPTINHPSRDVSFSLLFHPLTHTWKSEGPAFSHTDRIPSFCLYFQDEIQKQNEIFAPNSQVGRTPCFLSSHYFFHSLMLSLSSLYLSNSSNLSKLLSLFWKTQAKLALSEKCWNRICVLFLFVPRCLGLLLHFWRSIFATSIFATDIFTA